MCFFPSDSLISNVAVSWNVNFDFIIVANNTVVVAPQQAANATVFFGGALMVLALPQNLTVQAGLSVRDSVISSNQLVASGLNSTLVVIGGC